jgi:hypothetical protein
LVGAEVVRAELGLDVGLLLALAAAPVMVTVWPAAGSAAMDGLVAADAVAVTAVAVLLAGMVTCAYS